MGRGLRIRNLTEGRGLAPRRQAGFCPRRRPKGLPRHAAPLCCQATSVTPSGSFAPVMKATASDIE